MKYLLILFLVFGSAQAQKIDTVRAKLLLADKEKITVKWVKGYAIIFTPPSKDASIIFQDGYGDQYPCYLFDDGDYCFLDKKKKPFPNHILVVMIKYKKK